MIKVLIVDDSAFMRSALTRMLEEDPEIKVIGQAGDGEEGLRKVEELNPDLVTLDLEMPRLDGIGMLERRRSPRSARWKRGRSTSFQNIRKAAIPLTSCGGNCTAR